MSLTKRKKTYWLDVRISGKRIRRSLHTDDKLLALYKYKEEKDRLILEYSGKKIGFSRFCDQYLTWAWSSKPKSTLRESQRLNKIKEFFTLLDIIYLDDITPYHIEQLKAELKSRGLSKSTVNFYLQILRCMFNKAIDWEIYQKPNPLKKVRFFRVDVKINPLTKSDVEKVILAARKISFEARSSLQKVILDVILFALNTGLRKSEILKLRWKDIRNDEIVVKGKGDKTRVVPLNSKSRAILERQPPKDSFVFDIPNRHNPDLLNKTTHRISRMIGRRFHFHLLRHHFTSTLVEKGVDFVTISEILGHSKITMSLGYAHTSKERKQKAVDLIV